MSLWEPFTEQARRTIVRAQEVAQLFAASYIGTEHIAFALAESDDDVGRILTNAIDRDELRQRLGAARGSPQPEMVFTPGAKRTIELSFENARRLNHNYIGTAHIALAVLSSPDPPPFRAGVDLAKARAELDEIDSGEKPLRHRWSQTTGAGPPPATARSIMSDLSTARDLSEPGTQVTITITQPNGTQQTWTWTNIEEPNE